MWCVVEYSSRTCNDDGQWQGKHPGDGGWTNYTDCYTAESKAVFHMLFEHITPQVASRSSPSVCYYRLVSYIAQASFRVVSSSHFSEPQSVGAGVPYQHCYSLLRWYLSHCTKLLYFRYFSTLTTCDQSSASLRISWMFLANFVVTVLTEVHVTESLNIPLYSSSAVDCHCYVAHSLLLLLLMMMMMWLVCVIVRWWKESRWELASWRLSVCRCHSSHSASPSSSSSASGTSYPQRQYQFYLDNILHCSLYYCYCNYY